MRLFLSPTSPFAREVKVALSEKNLLDSTEQVYVDPWDSPVELVHINPLSQVPALELDDGQVLTDSSTILQWLEIAYPMPRLLPEKPADCARVLGTAALAQGVIESVVYVVIERRKPSQQQSGSMLSRRRRGIERALLALEERFDCSRERFLLDGLHLACALAYVDLRLPDFDWRMGASRLGHWYAWAAGRRSMQESAPPTQ